MAAALSLGCDLLEPLGIVALDADQNRERRTVVSLMDFDLVPTRVIKLGVEVAWLGIASAQGSFAISIELRSRCPGRRQTPMLYSG